jgi:hypothetical protein
MKRFHLHMSVENLDESINFDSTLFATAPAVRQAGDDARACGVPEANGVRATRRDSSCCAK